ncbi:MAG TPA: hypothetical protein H9729_01565 [Candidatus Borkfalkia excrementigallinarum]|uniref:Uncharacterized protein n=1 Tax=Candidatus Borkfalkia excrementigallinarum TaxID=2838506 RepID=A0A9D1ZVU4_9FIRM|nr:hypothetical protein [Candidatus Borkfalkia excrementigallinarum]
MAKKNLKYFIPGAIALVLGIVAFCMMFLPAVTYTDKLGLTNFSIKGSQLTFGDKLENFDVETLNFNIMMLLGFGLPLIGGVLALLFKNGLITKIITTACFVVGAVFLFSTTGFTAISMTQDAKDLLLLGYNESLAVGPIVAGVVSIIGAVVCFFKGTLAKMFK